MMTKEGKREGTSVKDVNRRENSLPSSSSSNNKEKNYPFKNVKG